MESVGAISEGEWSSFSAMYSNEESEFMAQLLNSCSLPNELPGGSSFRLPSTCWPGHESAMNMAGVDEDSTYSSDNTNSNTNIYCFSEGSSYSGGRSIFVSTSTHNSYYPSDSDQILVTHNDSTSDYCMGEGKSSTSPFQVFTNDLLEGNDFLNQDMSGGSMEESGGNLPKVDIQGKNLQLGREALMQKPEPSKENKLKNPVENPKKRCYYSGDTSKVQKIKRNVKSRKNQKLISTSKNDEDNNAAINRQSSSSYCSEDDSNASHELNGGVTSTSDSKGAAVVNTNGKARASKGSATDPQSLYARKRREIINERLRTLQNLVPNGTKVDISTMLEEAVQYVKFLQLQIKLLSSDNLWMYAPIAYNGMDLGLNLNITM